MANGFSCRLLRTFLLRLPKKWLFSAASVKYRGDALSSELNLQEGNIPSADMYAMYAQNMIAAQLQEELGACPDLNTSWKSRRVIQQCILAHRL